MIDTVAAVFGLSADDFVKVTGAVFGGLAMLAGAITKLIEARNRPRRRIFIKIERLERAAIQEELRRNGGGPLTGVYLEMFEDQRKAADEKDIEREN